MAIGIISAIPEEYSKLSWDEAPRTETIITKTFQFGKISGVDVIAAECGIGKVNAAMTTSLLLGHYACDGIIFSGVAGGINPNLKIGQVIIAEELIQHDYGTMSKNVFFNAIPGSFPGYTADDRDVGYKMPSAMKNTIHHLLGTETDIHFGKVLTGDMYVACGTTREQLRLKFGADAVEMEGAAIAQVCCNWHKPFVVIRVLSDLAGNTSHFDFDTFVDESSEKAANLTQRLLPILDAWL